MCGPLIAASTSGFSAVAVYHVTRLAGYLALGALAGLVGETVLATSAVNVFASWAAALTIGLTFVFLGVQSWRGRAPHLPMPRFVGRVLPRIFNGRYRGPHVRAGVIGLFTALLPCGWLHSFVLAAVTTKSVASGATLMALFWMGTLPALTAAPVLFHRVLGPLTRRAPRITAVLLIAAGVGLMGSRVAATMRAGGHERHAMSSPAAETPSVEEKNGCH